MCAYAVVSLLRQWFTGVRHINLRSVNYNNPHRICQKAAGEGYCLMYYLICSIIAIRVALSLSLGVLYNDIKQGIFSVSPISVIPLKAIFNKVIS